MPKKLTKKQLQIFEILTNKIIFKDENYIISFNDIYPDGYIGFEIKQLKLYDFNYKHGFSSNHISYLKFYQAIDKLKEYGLEFIDITNENKIILKNFINEVGN